MHHDMNRRNIHPLHGRKSGADVCYAHQPQKKCPSVFICVHLWIHGFYFLCRGFSKRCWTSR
jgi:hypothetical protein